MKENKPKPACYAVFEEDQSIRIWGNHPILIEGLRKRFGDRLRPLYITPQPDPSVSALVEALEEISDPIRFMEERLEEGERLNGMAAVQLAKDASYLRGIALKALATYHNQGVDE